MREVPFQVTVAVPVDDLRVRERAYFLHREHPERAAERNWRDAEGTEASLELPRRWAVQPLALAADPSTGGAADVANQAPATGEVFRRDCPRVTATDESGQVVLDGCGAVVMSEHARLSVRIEFDSLVPRTDLDDGPYWLTGRTNDGTELDAPACYLAASGWASSSRRAWVEFLPLECFLRNPATIGRAWTRRILKLKNTHTLWPQRWTDDSFAFHLRSLANSASRPARERSGLLDAELEVQVATPMGDDFGDTRTLVLDLLSLAARSPCVAPIEEVWSGIDWIETRLCPSDWDFSANNPLIPADSLAPFMTLATPGYRKQEPLAGLHVLISYYCRSHTESMAEFKFLFAGVVMEALKFNWALNVFALPTKKTASGIVKKFVKPDGKTPYSFEELLSMVAADLGVSATYSFIENRNAIFHTGEAAAAQLGHASVWPVLKLELTKLPPVSE